MTLLLHTEKKKVAVSGRFCPSHIACFHLPCNKLACMITTARIRCKLEATVGTVLSVLRSNGVTCVQVT